ncbi:ricin B lectin domain-containing protein [Ustulina deusta]|nr:ricin B lectin domain-containing protein [Ustulina deusta]
MPFTGPGLYEIVPFRAQGLTASAWDGLLDAGALVRLSTRTPSDPATNSVWEVALASGEGESAEYLILNALTGYPITATADRTTTSTPQISPADPTTRWTIESIGSDVFTINNKVASRGQFSVKGGDYQSGVDIMAWVTGNTDNQKWYFERRP